MLRPNQNMGNAVDKPKWNEEQPNRNTFVKTGNTTT